MLENITILAILPDAAAEKERARRLESLGADELRICLAGEILFAGTEGQVVLAFHDVPLLGFALDLVYAMREIMSGKRETSWTDFYGEFEVRIVRDADNVEVVNNFSAQSFTTKMARLQNAIGEWGLSLTALVEAALPQLRQNANYPPLRREIIGGR